MKYGLRFLGYCADVRTGNLHGGSATVATALSLSHAEPLAGSTSEMAPRLSSSDC